LAGEKNKMQEQETEEPKEQTQEETAETAEEAPEEALEEKEEEAPAEEVGAEVKEEEVKVAVEEEVKPPKEKKPEEEIVEERVYTVPLGKAWIMPPRKRSPRAMRMVRAFVTKHMKLEAEKGEEEEEEPRKLVISNEVNEKVWARGVEKPPRKIRVRAAKDKEGNVTVYLAEGD